MAIQKNDFVELEFTGRANNEIFDTTSIEEAKQMGLDADVNPISICVGAGMLLKGFDDSLEGKEIGKKYTISLTPENAFGKRQVSMIRPVPLKIFIEKEMHPYPGMTVQLDNHIAKIISVSGGRVIVDFNNPLAGKDVEYIFTIKKKIEDEKEKIEALQNFFFREKYDFEVKDKKIILKNKPTDPLASTKIKFLAEIFNKKFQEILGLSLEVEKGSVEPSAKKDLLETK